MIFFRKQIHIISTTLLIFSFFSVYSQNKPLQNISDLENKLSKNKFLDTILSLPYEVKTSDSGLFLVMVKKANEIAKQNSDTIKLALSFENLGLAYHLTNNFDKAIESTISAADLFYEKGNYVKYGNCYVNLGWRINRRDLQKGLYYMIKGINILEKYGGKTAIPLIGAYNNYGFLKQRNLENDSAMYYHKKSFDLCIYHKDSLGMSYAMVEMAKVYGKFSEYEKAENLFDDALKIRTQLNDIYGIADSHELYGDYYLSRNMYDEAIKFYDVALKMAIDYSFNYMKKNIVQNSYKAYAAKNQYKKAYEYLLKHKQITDSTNNVDVENRIRQLDIQFQTNEKEKELLQTRTEKAETELQLSKTRGWIFVLIGGLAVTTLLFFSINQRNKRKAQEQITKEKELGFKAIIDAQEQERSKIARELHDGVVQQIGSVILKSRSLFASKNIEQDEQATQVLTSLENSNKDLRNISHQMMPIALKELGIIPALKDLLEGSLGYANVKFNLEHFNINSRLPEKIEITIYRITQELINNIIKHSKATEVSVQLFKNQGNVLLIVEDNGVGFSSTKNKKGIGLLNISSRLDMVNGKVNFEPSPNSGTLVTVKIPT